MDVASAAPRARSNSTIVLDVMRQDRERWWPRVRDYGLLGTVRDLMLPDPDDRP